MPVEGEEDSEFSWWERLCKWLTTVSRRRWCFLSFLTGEFGEIPDREAAAVTMSYSGVKFCPVNHNNQGSYVRDLISHS